MSNVEFNSSFALIKGEITDKIRENVEMATIFLEGEVTQKLGTGDRTGHVYPVPGTKNVTYIASAPGEAPAVQLADLLNSISHEIVEPNEHEVIGAVGTNMEYAARLEFGFKDTDSLGREYDMEPRPYLRSTYLENREQIIEILKGE